MKNYTLIGLGVGLAVALITAVGGWVGLILAILFGVIGALIGAHLDGRINLTDLASSVTLRRDSSRGGRGR